jgi:hypothetical protein
MKAKHILLVSVVALLPALIGRPSYGETIEHGDLLPGNSIPEGSAALCPGVPDDVALIPELQTGWAVDIGDGALRLVFSDRVIACGASESGAISDYARDACESGWAIGFDLPVELEPGVYDLSEVTSVFSETIAQGETGSGCSSECSVASSGGGTWPGAPGPEGTLEIYSVNDDCITGRLAGFVSTQIEPPPPEFNGAFHAVRCNP